MLLGQGMKMPEVCKRMGVAEQTYYCWRKEYGGLKMDQAKKLKDLEKENARLKKLVAVAVLTGRFAVSLRRACRLLSQPRATQRYLPSMRDDEKPLTKRIVELASIFGRYGYRRITAALLRGEGWWVIHKRVERFWRREGLKVPQKQPMRGRL